MEFEAKKYFRKRANVRAKTTLFIPTTHHPENIQLMMRLTVECFRSSRNRLSKYQICSPEVSTRVSPRLSNMPVEEANEKCSY